MLFSFYDSQWKLSIVDGSRILFRPPFSSLLAVNYPQTQRLVQPVAARFWETQSWILFLAIFRGMRRQLPAFRTFIFSEAALRMCTHVKGPWLEEAVCCVGHCEHFIEIGRPDSQSHPRLS